MIRSLQNQLAAWFEEAGLVFLGIVDLDVNQDFQRFSDWLSNGQHADMHYLENYLDLRKEPKQLLEGAQTAIVVGYNYFQGRDQVNAPGKIAQYARLKDYHKFIKSRCKTIIEKISSEENFVNEKFRITIDSAPLLERALAKKTSRGFIGKNTCYIHPEQGSFFLLGEILTTIPFHIDTPTTVDPTTRSPSGGCGSCKRCQVHCPTGALDEDYQINAKKCISYWTIEHRGAIPQELWPWLKTYVFGCDICQLVCPYNRGATATEKNPLQKLNAQIDLYALATITQEKYEELLGGTPMTRAKRHGLRRNALISMYVNKDTRLQKALNFVTTDPHPVLEETAKQISATGNVSR